MSEFVHFVQQRLRANGYYTCQACEIDGIPGRLTAQAIKQFQQGQGIRVTGTANAETVARLRSGAGLTEHKGPAPTDAPGADLPWYTEARRHLGLAEAAGPANNPTIMDWAEHLDVLYPNDSVPWCGLFMGYVISATLPDETLPDNVLGARQWARFGAKTTPKRGAVLVFWRGSPSGWQGHVGLYHAEDPSAYHVLGGNQGDSVSIVRIAKSRLLGARWPLTAADLDSQPVQGPATGRISTKES
jgi:uncharacterized protein (TIGR02594 family)